MPIIRQLTLTLLLLIGAGSACAQEPAVPETLRVRVASAAVTANEPLVLTISVENLSREPIVLPADFSPEGWLVAIQIRDRSSGAQVYASPRAKVEMTASKLKNLITIEPRSRATFDLQTAARLAAGEYVVEATLTTSALADRAVPGMPNGSWRSATETLNVRAR